MHLHNLKISNKNVTIAAISSNVHISNKHILHIIFQPRQRRGQTDRFIR